MRVCVRACVCVFHHPLLHFPFSCSAFEHQLLLRLSCGREQKRQSQNPGPSRTLAQCRGRHLIGLKTSGRLSFPPGPLASHICIHGLRYLCIKNLTSQSLVWAVQLCLYLLPSKFGGHISSHLRHASPHNLVVW